MITEMPVSNILCAKVSAYFRLTRQVASLTQQGEIELFPERHKLSFRIDNDLLNL